jgi:AraC-like DNA-binding protein
VPRAALLPLARDIDQASTRVVRPAGGILGLLRAYVTSLRKSADAADPSLGPLAAVHVCELVAMAIGTTRDGEQAALAGGVRAARMQAIKADFAGNPALTLAAIAARHKVTPRYVQLLFEAEGTTFTAYALEQRLGDAWRRLTSPRYEHWTIARIALEAGFGDLSHFNRAFRRRYRVAPSEARAEAANSGALANTR